MMAATAAVVLAGWAAGSLPEALQAQNTTQTGQQQTVPDAPKPQTLPQRNAIIPVAPAVPDAPSSTASPKPAVPDAPVPAVQKPAKTEDDDVIIPPAGRGAYDIPTIRTYVTFVEVPFLVKDARGRMVPGITERDVQVFENGVRQPIRYFTSDAFPLSVALVIDQSVSFKLMEQVNGALGAMQSAFSPYDQVALFTYNNGVTLQDPANGFNGASSARFGALLDQSKGKGREQNVLMGGPLAQTTNINGRYDDPNTSPNHRSGVYNEYQQREFHTLNDAILAAAIQLTKTTNGPGGQHRRRVIYVISDGKEYGSKAREKDVIKFCQTNNIAVYATLVGDTALPVVGFLDRIHIPLTLRENALPRYTSATGGQLDAEVRTSGIEQSFARIAEESRAQYFLGFNSQLPPLSEKFRTLEVRVLRPNMTVVAREGYYPNATQNRPLNTPASAQTTTSPVQSPAVTH